MSAKDTGLDELRRNEARLRALLDAIPDLMIRFDRDGTYTDITGNTSGLVRTREEMIGRNVRDFLPQHVVDRVMACVERAIASKSTQTLEYELDVGGERRLFEARMTPSGGDEIVSIVRDITPAHRLERELAERLREVQHEQAFTRTVVNTAPIVLMLCDEEGAIIRFNDTAERLTGYHDDERVWGRPVSQVFVHPEDAEAFETSMRRVEPGRLPEEIECRWLTKTGEELIMDCTINHVLDGQGLHRRIVAGLDVTEREQSRLELVRQRDLLGVVARATPNLLFVAEPDGRVAWEGVNPAFEDMTGHDDSTACGREFWELVVAPEQVDAVRKEFAAAVASGEVRYFSAEVVTQAGERRTIDWTSRPLVGLDNRTKQLLCGVDVTERERHLQEIRASRARLVEAQDAERRRLERNLHDGAQQRLVSLSLALRLAQAKLAADPEGAGDILAAAGRRAHAGARRAPRARARDPSRDAHRPRPRRRRREPRHARARAHRGGGNAGRPAARAGRGRGLLRHLGGARQYRQVRAGNGRQDQRDERGRPRRRRDRGRRCRRRRSRPGTGLRGLVDRVEALDGSLEVESPVGGGYDGSWPRYRGTDDPAPPRPR